MENKKTLEQILKELKDAEKEFNEKCLKYGISEKKEKKQKEKTQNEENLINNQKENTNDNFYQKTSEN